MRRRGKTRLDCPDWNTPYFISNQVFVYSMESEDDCIDLCTHPSYTAYDCRAIVVIPTPSGVQCQLLLGYGLLCVEVPDASAVLISRI